MVNGLHLGSLCKASVRMKDGLRETCGSGREVDGSKIIFGELDSGIRARIISYERPVVLGESRLAFTADEDEHSVSRDLICVGVNTVYELGSEDQYRYLCKIRAVRYLISRISEIERNCDGSCLQDSEVDGKPLEAVEHEDRDLIALLNALIQEHVGNAVRLLIEDLPCQLSSVVLCWFCLLNQIIFLI